MKKYGAVEIASINSFHPTISSSGTTQTTLDSGKSNSIKCYLMPQIVAAFEHRFHHLFGMSIIATFYQEGDKDRS